MQATTKITQRTATTTSGSPITVLSFSGDISSTSREVVLDAYHHLNGANPAVLLDFSNVEYINSSGIAIIIQMLMEAGKSESRSIGIFGLTPHFQKVFTMVGINKYAALHHDEAGALSAV